MLALRRCLSASRRPPPPRPVPPIARASAGAVPFPSAGRGYATSPPLGSDGNLADVCNSNVISSPFPPIADASIFTAVPDFVSSSWTDPSVSGKVAVRDGSTGETRTFAQYGDRARRIASALRREYGIKPNDTVALYSLNNVDYLPICLGAAMVGARVTPINPLSTRDELAKVLVPSGSRVLFAHARLLPIALDAARDSPCVESVVVIPDAGSDATVEGAEELDRLATYEGGWSDEGSRYVVEDLSSHPVLLPYSSGTTGLPKGVMLSHANIVANLLQFDAVEGEVFPPEHKVGYRYWKIHEHNMCFPDFFPAPISFLTRKTL